MALVELGRYSRNEAHILIGRLESEGVAAVAFDSDMAFGGGDWLLHRVRVMVDDDDLALAQRIIAS